MTLPRHSIPVSGRFWRMMFLADADKILEPARSPVGRSHHDGQRALYLSETPLGTQVAIKRYRAPGDAPRGIFPV